MFNIVYTKEHNCHPAGSTAVVPERLAQQLAGAGVVKVVGPVAQNTAVQPPRNFSGLNSLRSGNLAR